MQSNPRYCVPFLIFFQKCYRKGKHLVADGDRTAFAEAEDLAEEYQSGMCRLTGGHGREVLQVLPREVRSPKVTGAHRSGVAHPSEDVHLASGTARGVFHCKLPKPRAQRGVSMLVGNRILILQLQACIFQGYLRVMHNIVHSVLVGSVFLSGFSRIKPALYRFMFRCE